MRKAWPSAAKNFVLSTSEVIFFGLGDKVTGLHIGAPDLIHNHTALSGEKLIHCFRSWSAFNLVASVEEEASQMKFLDCPSVCAAIAKRRLLELAELAGDKCMHLFCLHFEELLFEIQPSEEEVVIRSRH